MSCRTQSPAQAAIARLERDERQLEVCAEAGTAQDRRRGLAPLMSFLHSRRNTCAGRAEER
jgi:hypothetical protein